MIDPASSYELRDTSMRILPVRGDCLLVELADLDETLALFAALENAPIEGVKEVIPAARTLLISFSPNVISRDSLVDSVSGRAGGAFRSATRALVEIPVRYDGQDLSEVANFLGMTEGEVVRLHGESEYVAAFTGFAPGFAYLSGGDPRLTVPRRSSPRVRVPARSVGLAGAFSGVYPKDSPGGWQLIGTTPLQMFDILREPASLLQPGNRVKFRSMADDPAYEIKTAPSNALKPAPATLDSPVMLTVLTSAIPALFQDLGRSGQASQGISISGAADRASFVAANRLLGNPPNTPAIEITLGNFSFRMHGRSVMALTGAVAPISITSIDRQTFPAPHHRAVALNDGDVVTIGTPTAGMRSYLSLRGGLEAPAFLGSAATDTLAQIGPAALASGDRIAVRPAPGNALIAFDEPAFTMPQASEPVVIDVVMGPRTDWFTPAGVESFLAQEWTTTAQSSRVGIRLSGTALERANHDELPSEATVRGALQVPASGQPVLFLADHPLTGGYPVIANVAGHHLDLAGQIPIGARIRFNPIASFASRFIQGKRI